MVNLMLPMLLLRVIVNVRMRHNYDGLLVIMTVDNRYKRRYNMRKNSN